MPKVILSIDQGTTGTTIGLFDVRCRLLAEVKVEFRQIFPKPGWVEHNLEDIWGSVLQGIRKACTRAKIQKKDIVAIGITNQRETTGVWERSTGRPVHNAIVWQCRRTASLCEELKKAGHEPLFRERTGLVLDPYFSGTKLHWHLDNLPNLRARSKRGDICFGTVDSFLVYRLTGNSVHVTDVSNASRTLLMNLDTLAYDEELLKILNVPKSMLPEIRSSSEIYGKTKNVPGLPDGIPISGMAGDQQAALFGQACFEPGQTKCTYGTGAFVLMNTGSKRVKSSHGLLTSVGWKIGSDTVYVLEGSVFIAGAAVQWLRDGLKIISRSSDIARLALSVKSSDGVVFVPALVGLGAPHWNPNARGVIAGITRGTTAAHLARATLEGIAFQVREVTEAMRKDSNRPIGLLRVDGGASQNNLLLQFQSDILGVEIHRPKITATTALGAAMLAGLSVGFWKNLEEIRHRWSIERVFSPRMPKAAVNAHLARWSEAVLKA
jgi:glycerol kinase